MDELVVTEYEKTIRKNWVFILVWLIVFFTTIVTIDWFIPDKYMGDDLISTIVNVSFLLFITVLIVIMIIWSRKALKKIKIQRIKQADFFLTYNRSSIVTKFCFTTTFNRRPMRVHGLMSIDMFGIKNNKKNILWTDYTISIQQIGITTAPILNFILTHKTNNSNIIININPKNFYIIKKFSGYQIPNEQEILDWMDSKYRLLTSDKKTFIGKNLENAQIFKPHLIASICIICLIIFALTGAIIGLVIYFKLDSSLSSVIGVMIILPIVMPILILLPQGVTYINKDVAACQIKFRGEQVIKMEKAQIKYGKFTIVISSPVFTIRIYKTKRAVAWLESCKNSSNTTTH